MCESWHDLMQRYDMVDRVDFVSDKDIDSFMHYYALRYGDYDVLHNNCEMFANCFSGRELNNQNRMYNIVGIILLTALLFALIKDKTLNVWNITKDSDQSERRKHRKKRLRHTN